HVHHVHWYGRDDGPTDTWNLAVECGACHRHIHQGHINITGNADLPDGLVYTDEHGRSLIRHPVPIPPTAPPPDPAMPYRHPLGERLHPRWLWFKPTPEPAPAQAATTPGGPAPPATDAAA
ncbi:MAG: hypothetical protein JWN99_2727, partial [Ilumatobacteraceae bacterium]|nr:hypothetical protein [Ilumatobacteraceae bacterium]